MHRLALAIEKGGGSGATAPADRSGDSSPRTDLFDEAFAPAWDESILGDRRVGWGPKSWLMSREIQRRHTEYDAVITWGEKLSLAMLVPHRGFRLRKPHIAMMYQFEKPNIRLPLTLLRSNLHAVITWSSVQRRALIERIGYPAGRIYLIRHYVDQIFYSPRPATEDMICAVGAEMRDYATLKEALRGTDLRCHIAADHVRVPGRYRILRDRRIPVDRIDAGGNSNVTSGRMPLTGLRDLYARSRFVVVPLRHSDTDNGVTVMLEAMAMGKPVICSRTRGQVDVLQEGVTGLYVPVGDPAAMRKAMLALWNDPDRAREMGRAARAHVERYHSLEFFTQTVKSSAEASLAGRPAPDTWWED